LAFGGQEMSIPYRLKRANMGANTGRSPVALHYFRRLVIRREYRVESFFGMVLGCIQILLRQL
jgi:hypothetical protein